MVREQGATIKNAEDFFNADTRRQLETGLLSQLQARLNPKGFEIQDVLVRDISLPQVLSKAIEMKKEREQAVERQKAELERFRTEQLQKVALAEAERKAAEEESEKRIILAKARAFEIREINKAVASNPAYIQLQALEALKAMSKDPAAKIYFMDGSSTNPLPLLHMGDRQ
jgi:regulator of protease activity HflC (stomatin/prohibitin superfamily)